MVDSTLTLGPRDRLEKIDIRGNPFKDIPDVAAALSTVPNLKHLFMTLKAEADEDALFSFLPKVLACLPATVSHNAVSRMFAPRTLIYCTATQQGSLTACPCSWRPSTAPAARTGS